MYRRVSIDRMDKIRGESGISPISKDEYFKECEPDVISGIFCTYFGLPKPKLKELPAPRIGR